MKTDMAVISQEEQKYLKEKLRRKRRGDILSSKYLYLMILPGVLYFIIFKYIPMGGLAIAFQDYQPFLKISGSPWVGMKHFIRLFTDSTFLILLRNTLTLFFLQLVITFPIPIVIALLLNEVRMKWFKSSIQTIIYIPHFMSWVIVVSISYVFLNVDGGIVNGVLESLGMNKIPFLTSKEWFRPMYVGQILWKEAGWGTIMYIAAITAVDDQLYEAAEIDGANRFKRCWHITLPAIRGMIITMLILKVGRVLDLGFEHVFLILNSLNRDIAEIFDTYIYTAGMKNGQLSFSTAIGMFKSVVGLILVIGTNKIAKLVGEDGVY